MVGPSARRTPSKQPRGMPSLVHTKLLMSAGACRCRTDAGGQACRQHAWSVQMLHRSRAECHVFSWFYCCTSPERSVAAQNSRAVRMLPGYRVSKAQLQPVLVEQQAAIKVHVAASAALLLSSAEFASSQHLRCCPQRA
jgi:hypothetical protein